MSPLPKPANSSRHWRTLACHGVPDLDSSLGLLRFYLDPPANQRSGCRRAMARWEAVDGASEKRAALLAAAFEEALSRLRGWAPYSAVESSPAIAAVGECLFWLVALDELAEHVDLAWRGDSSEVKEQLRGLRCARNAVAHGHSVIAPTGWQPGAELGDLVLGRSRTRRCVDFPLGKPRGARRGGRWTEPLREIPRPRRRKASHAGAGSSIQCVPSLDARAPSLG